jgi:hypothetical protein
MRVTRRDILFEAVLEPNPGYRTLALMHAAGWVLLPLLFGGMLLMMGSLAPDGVQALGWARYVGACVLIMAPWTCWCLCFAAVHVSSGRPLYVWLTRDAIVFRGIVGWGLRRIPYEDIQACWRADRYRLPRHTLWADKVRWLPGQGVWAYGPGFGRGAYAMHTDTLTAWQGAQLMLTRGRSVFIEMDEPQGFLAAIAERGVMVTPSAAARS